jgi:sigma-B regulation protein RsbU (phosphoserine phosphatase)
MGLLSEDVGDDPGLLTSGTLLALNLRSFLCVPLIGAENRRLGVVQLDCTRPGQVFRREDLEVLTAVTLQATLALENAYLHAQQVRQARLHQDLLLAREIQHAFLPADFEALARDHIDLYAQMQPAREVSGDLYDFFRLPDGRLAFFLGDVSGKGMPAALFMFAVRTLIRYLTPASAGPADLLTQLNRALVADNPTSLYVTLIHGVYDPVTGTLVLARGGHPPPLLRRRNGTVEQLPLPTGMFLGSSVLSPVYQNTSLTLQPEETLILYTDGFTEAVAPDERTQFGEDRLRALLGGRRTLLSLAQCAEEASEGLRQFTGKPELQDDQTLFLLRRR